MTIVLMANDGILGAAEVEVAHEPRHREHDDEEQHERGVLNRPGGEVAARDGGSGSTGGVIAPPR